MKAQTSTYKGAWFEVKYTTEFTAKGSIASKTSESRNFDSAFFYSPDGEVEFYVFSPQWSGEATDIALQPNEKEVSREVKKGKKLTVTHWTIAEKKHSYTRSYQQTHNNLENTTWIVGVKYKSIKSYNKYKKEYVAFKKSLVQFAD
ncbi:hypothetical protein CKY20_07580 [Capnocytophaga canis]|uniref:Uncharacterized protein n=2 Tax=Capnocytophaga canis TaxID=1848903 RepID=A0A3A1YFW4_9FLAO|nr:hypothetical protein CKY20_07580 [Capnocytophaga canis]